MRAPIFAANWKMNKTVKETPEFVPALRAALASVPSVPYEVLIAPPATHLAALGGALRGTSWKLGAQNCGQAKSGAYTGEISPVVLKEVGCDFVILGHSERRHVYGETDRLVLARLTAAVAEGLKVILCVGEKLEERKANKTFSVIDTQLAILSGLSLGSQLVIAYEPVWAIGTGENASPEQAQEVHAYIRKGLGAAGATTPILYGGSVKPDNAGALLGKPDVDGFLIGGASLEPGTFAGVIKNGLESRT